MLGGEGGGGDLPERSPASQQWMSGSDGLDPAGGQNVYLEEKSSYATQREQEGIARDLVRLVQQARRSAGFHVADHISLALNLKADLQKIISQHEQYIREETLADKVQFENLEKSSYTEQAVLNGENISIELLLL